jgi:Raf kinase inhibitor-like YbhB/YbcL family protein
MSAANFVRPETECSRRLELRLALAMIVFAIPFHVGCHRAAQALPNALNLYSAGLNNGSIPATYTCDGANTSPALAWSAPPVGTVSLALILTDPDAPQGTFVHWVVYNLPATARSLPAAFSAQPQFADGIRQGRNDFDDMGYGGPCPPVHSEHRYVFDLYALDATLSLASGATRSQVENALTGHVLARGRLIGRYSR